MARLIKALAYAAPFIFIFFACKSEQPQRSHHRLLIFLDKSHSVSIVNAGSLKSQIMPFVNKMTLGKGDRVSIHLIHEATVGAVAVLEDSITFERPTDNGQGPKDFEQDLSLYEQKLNNFRNNAYTRLQSQIDATSGENVAKETDMLGTLQIISDFMKNAASGDSLITLYISDMIDSHKGRPRDYNAQPIKDLTDSETCATNDYAWLQKNLKISPSAFQNLKVHIIFPVDLYAKNSSAQMMYYWQALFQKINPTVQLSRN